jgi:hypothetical protein
VVAFCAQDDNAQVLQQQGICGSPECLAVSQVKTSTVSIVSDLVLDSNVHSILFTGWPDGIPRCEDTEPDSVYCV